MQNFAELHLTPETLAQYGLPDIPYRVPATDLKSALLDNGDLPLAVMLHGLQQRSRDGEAEWQQVQPAMDRLAELLAPDDARDVVSAAGDHWWLEVGPADLGGKPVTIQRGDVLIAAITTRDDGRLRDESSHLPFVRNSHVFSYMNTTTKTAELIRQRIEAMPIGEPFTPTAFLECGTRASVDQTLSRLVKAGAIERVTRGILVRPEVCRFVGTVMPEPLKAAETVAKTTGAVVHTCAACSCTCTWPSTSTAG
jgi:hypothetical protein